MLPREEQPVPQPQCLCPPSGRVGVPGIYSPASSGIYESASSLVCREWPSVSTPHHPPLLLIDEDVSCQEKLPSVSGSRGKVSQAQGPAPHPIPVPDLVPSPSLTAQAFPRSPQPHTLTSKQEVHPRIPTPGPEPHPPRPATCSSLPSALQNRSNPGPKAGMPNSRMNH